MRHPNRTLLLGLLMLFASEAGAQDPVRLTLEDAIARGIAESHRLAELAARREATEAAADVATASGRPTVSLQAGYVRTNHVPEFSLTDPTTGSSVLLYPDVPDNLSTRLDLAWPIYTGGRSNALARAARADADALGQDRVAARNDLKLEITRAYWGVVTAAAAERVLEQSLARMEAHVADTRALLKVGLAPPSDVLSSEAQRSRQQTLLIEARNLRESAATDLRRLVGLPQTTAITIEDTLAPPPAPATPVGDMIDRARAERPERQAFELRLQGADERKVAASAGRLPSVTVAGGYDYARPNTIFFPRAAEWNDSWDVGVRVDWSVWDFGRTKAEVARVAANRRALQEGYREFDTVLETDVRQRHLDLESALAAVTSAEDGVRSAAEARRVVTERYTAGLATNTEVLDAEVLLLQSELDRTRAIASARLAAARLDRAIGR
jgi:outer membrane protein TolC